MTDLKKLRELAEMRSRDGSDVPKLLAIIEKLKEQQKHLAKFVADPIGGNWGGLMQEFYKELDEIVGQP